MTLLPLGAIPPTVLLLSTLSIILFSALVYRAFLSRLSQVPGPWPCRFTSLWIWYHSYLGHEASLITSLHAQYGPIVRIGLQECVISDGAALNAIYNERGGFRKADCYANFDFEGHATIFSARDTEHRALRSKAVTPLFSTSKTRAGQKRIEACVQRFVERVKSEAQSGKPVDILNLSRSLALDAVSSYLFGRPYGGIEEMSDRLSASVFVDTLVDTGRFFFLPHWLFVAIGEVSARLMPCANAAVEVGGTNLESFARMIVRDSPAGDDTFQGRLKAVGISDHENEVQCMDLLFAGRDKLRDVYYLIPWLRLN
jgi:cytochrome P450